MPGESPAVRRVLSDLGVEGLVEQLGELPGSDLTSLLLAVMRNRSRRVEAPQLVSRYRNNRFVVRPAVSFANLRRVEDGFLAAASDKWEVLSLSPLVPFATHAALGHFSQDRVVSTVRDAEVAADPTTALTLEAALRRRAARSEVVRLSSIQRVVRAQHFGEGVQSHFSLFALVTAGRDKGGHEFEAAALAEHVAVHVAGALAAGVSGVQVVLTDWTDGGRDEALHEVEELYAGSSQVKVTQDPTRQAARGYYESLCFKVRASFGGEDFEVSDGGFTRWTASLLQDQKERLCISASGLDRLARN
jgi:hypothetical protein